MSDPEIDKAGPVRRFTDADIRARVNKALDHVSEGRRGAVVVYADSVGARVAVMGKVLSFDALKWSVVVDKPWHGKLDVESALVFEW